MELALQIQTAHLANLKASTAKLNAETKLIKYKQIDRLLSIHQKSCTYARLHNPIPVMKHLEQLVKNEFIQKKP